VSGVSTGRRRTLVTVALVGLIVAVPVAVYALGRESSAFHVRHIVLSGQRKAHTRPLRKALKSAFLGANLFSVNPARVRAALAEFPYIDGVGVDRRFPDTLKVRLTEFVPAALLFSRGRWYVLASEGRVLAEGHGPSPLPTAAGAPAGQASPGPAGSASPRPAGAPPSPAGAGTTSPAHSPSPHAQSAPSPPGPEIKLPAGARRLPILAADLPVTVGGTISDAPVRASLAALAALPARLRHETASAAATATSIRLIVTGGPVIEVGDTRNLRMKMLALRAVLGRYAARHIACTFVDVSVPDRPLAAPLLPAPAPSGHPSPRSP
jgi:cell division septal protein FtsQ